MEFRKIARRAADNFAVRTGALALCLALPLAPMGHAQIDLMKPAIQPQLIPAQAAATNPETVRILAALGKIESDLQLGMLFLQDGLTNPEGSHFAHPRMETLPGIKDGLAAAGAADLEPLLVALEAGGDAATVAGNYQAVITEIMMARSALKPTNRDLLLAILAQTEAVAGEINASGPTEVANYQDAWSMLMIARMQVDLLLGDPDPAVVSAATDIGLALDDVILSMPDPSVPEPVDFDPTPILALVAHMKDLSLTF